MHIYSKTYKDVISTERRPRSSSEAKSRKFHRITVVENM